MSLADDVATAAISKLSPSGALAEVANQHANPELDAILDQFDQVDAVAQHHLDQESLVARLEDDFALVVPAIADAAVPLENWAIPLLSSLAGPCAPVLSFGLLVACKVALAALTSWAKKRTGGMSK